MNLGSWRIIQEMSTLLSGQVLVLVSNLNGILLILDGRNLKPTTCFSNLYCINSGICYGIR